MPPRTRSGRADKLEAQELLKSGRANVAGLAAIPVEILVNIISHFSCIPVPYTETFGGHFPSNFLERLETLQTLAQTCRRLRSVVLPILWEKIEVAVRKHNGKDRGYSKRLATELVRQLEIVTIRDPTLAPGVREVSICLSDYCQATVSPELVRALQMFPNMRALQIFAPAHCIYHSSIARAFSGHTFPNVKLFTVTQLTITLAKSFPQVEYYYTCDYQTIFYHWEIITRHWKVVTEIHGLAVPDNITLASIATGLPNLSYLEIHPQNILISNMFSDMVPSLQLLKNLQVIKFIVPQHATGEQYAAAKANVASGLVKLQSPQKHRGVSVIIEFRNGAAGVLKPFETWFESSDTGVVIIPRYQSS